MIYVTFLKLIFYSSANPYFSFSIKMYAFVVYSLFFFLLLFPWDSSVCPLLTVWCHYCTVLSYDTSLLVMMFLYIVWIAMMLLMVAMPWYFYTFVGIFRCLRGFSYTSLQRFKMFKLVRIDPKDLYSRPQLILDLCLYY